MALQRRGKSKGEDGYGQGLAAIASGDDVLLDEEQREVWYNSTDGGLYRSLDGMETVENLSLTGLRVSQYYSTLTSTANPDRVAAGSQDQGYQIASSSTEEEELIAYLRPVRLVA